MTMTETWIVIYLINRINPNQNIVDTSNRRKVDLYSGDRLYRNDMNTPSKKFTDVSAKAGIYQSNLGYGLGIAIADINNDGWDDIYVGNDFHENDYYYINNTGLLPPAEGHVTLQKAALNILIITAALVWVMMLQIIIMMGNWM